MIRTTFKLAVLAIALLVAYLGITLGQVVLASRRDEARRVDAVVVFGAAQYNGQPSPVLKARLDHAFDLYEQGYADTIVVTGGRQPGDRFTEAAASATYLHRLGVPDSVILREVAGESSWDSLAAAAQLLRQRNKTTVLLVSDPFHAKRIEAMGEELGLEPYTSPTRTSPITGGRLVDHYVRETVTVAAGRVVGFRRLMRIDDTVTRVRDSSLSR